MTVDPALPIEPSDDAAPMLFGAAEARRLVAVEVRGETATLFERGERGVTHRTERFVPWLLAAEARPLAGARWRELAGEGHRWLAEFDRWDDFLAARAALQADRIPLIAFPSAVRQHLMRTGHTLFKGMAFGDLLRLQIDLETTTLSPTDPQARILLIALGTSDGRVWVLWDEDEAAMLRECVARIRSLDPDVIEGHHLFGFDLPYLDGRAKRLGVTLALGRDGSPLAFGRERQCPIGPNLRSYRPAYVWGRHCVDTLLGVMRFDIGRSELESYSLKDAAAHYGLAEPDRVILDRRSLAQQLGRQSERVERYARQDIAETRRLAELVFATEFYQTQMLPDSFQQVCVTGTGEKVNLLLMREYLRRGWGIPQPQPPRAFAGGYTQVRRTGVLHRVVKVDAESLYPSIMLAWEIQPASDRLGVFLPILRELTARRLDAKARARATSGAERPYWDGLQSSFKILINSFFGYLGGPFYFNDPHAAERVTLTAQEIARQLERELEATGSQVIEVDTDGIFFIPPENVRTEAEERDYIARLQAALPPGIRLAHDGRYRAMLSLKAKNYVLLDDEGRTIFRGASLRSRADERFGREFLTRAVDYLLAGDLAGLRAEYLRWCERIAAGALPIEDLVRRERVTEKRRDPTVRRRYDLPPSALLGDWVLVYERRDGSLAPPEQYARDEDRWRYLEKLYRFAARLRDALGERFDEVFPKPSRRLLAAREAGQGSLFDEGDPPAATSGYG